MTHNPDRRNWHLDKSVSVSHLVTTIAMFISGVWYIMGMQTQIELGREQNLYMQEQLKQMRIIVGEGNGPIRRDMDRIQRDLDKVNNKLDILAEKLSLVPKTRYLKDYQ